MSEAVLAVDLWRVRLPLRHALRAAHGTETDRELVLVQVQLEDGTVGWGECSALSRPTYTGEYTAGAWVLLRDELAPAVLARRPFDQVGHPMAIAGVVTAIADAVLQRAHRSLAIELASRTDEVPAAAVPVCAVVGRGAEVGDVVTAVAERIQAGVAMVKLKVTPDRADLAAVGAVRQAWPDLRLAVDFNGTADAESLRALDHLDLAYVEQPAPADALVLSAHLASCTGAPIALDESITSVGSLDAAVALGAGRIVNVKPARCGGPHAAAALLSRVRNAGLGAFVGGMLESGVGRAAALAVASLPACTLPTDLGPSLAYFERDLTAPLTVDESGDVVVPAGPGIGRAPVAPHLDAAVVDRVSLVR